MKKVLTVFLAIMLLVVGLFVGMNIDKVSADEQETTCVINENAKILVFDGNVTIQPLNGVYFDDLLATPLLTASNVKFEIKLEADGTVYDYITTNQFGYAQGFYIELDTADRFSIFNSDTFNSITIKEIYLYLN